MSNSHPSAARRLDGTLIAAAIRAELRSGGRGLHDRAPAVRPALDIVLVGDDPASDIYVRNKEQAAQEAGLAVDVHRLPASTSARRCSWRSSPR